MLSFFVASLICHVYETIDDNGHDRENLEASFSSRSEEPVGLSFSHGLKT